MFEFLYFSMYAVFIIMAIMMVVFLIFYVVLNCIMLKKAGKAWWAGLIPLYSSWELFKVAFGNQYGLISVLVLIIQFIPYVGIFIAYAITFYQMFYLFKSFGLDVGLCVLGLFFPFVPMVYISFSKNVQYIGPAPSYLHRIWPINI